MRLLFRYSFIALLAAGFLPVLSSPATAQETPQERQRARRATLTMFEDIDGFLRGAVKQYAALQPHETHAEFIRSSYWRQNDIVYSIVKVQMKEVLPIDASSPAEEQISAIRNEHANDEEVQIAVTDGNPQITLQYICYLYAGNASGSWQAYRLPTELSPNPKVQERALLERTIAKRQEKYLGAHQR